MKANFPNQRATKTMNTTVAMTTPTIPMRAVTDTSVLGGLKCEGKAAWKGENKMVKSKVRKKKSVSSRLGSSWQFFQKLLASSKELTVNIFIVFSKRMPAALKHQMWNTHFNFL